MEQYQAYNRFSTSLQIECPEIKTTFGNCSALVETHECHTLLDCNIWTWNSVLQRMFIPPFRACCPDKCGVKTCVTVNPEKRKQNATAKETETPQVMSTTMKD